MSETTMRAGLRYYFANESGWIAVRHEGLDVQDGRQHYAYSIGDGNTFHVTGDDVRSGSGQNVNLPAMLRTLLSFLSAFAESRAYGSPDSENWALFPDVLAEWAVAMSDEFALAALELGEEG